VVKTNGFSAEETADDLLEGARQRVSESLSKMADEEVWPGSLPMERHWPKVRRLTDYLVRARPNGREARYFDDRKTALLAGQLQGLIGMMSMTDWDDGMARTLAVTAAETVAKAPDDVVAAEAFAVCEAVFDHVLPWSTMVPLLKKSLAQLWKVRTTEPR
jgi:hypothetical protein